MKGVFVILDGVADDACQTLGHVTPLQAARTPNLDYLASKGSVGYCYSIKPGVIPQSSSSVISLFGRNPGEVSRGMLEARGAGIDVKRGDLVVRCNFATVEDIQGGNILDRRAGRTLGTKEAKILADSINREVKLPFNFEFYATNQHRGILVFRGGFSDNISNIDPAYGQGVGISKHTNKVFFSRPLDDEDDSKLSSDLINGFVRRSHEVLDKHALNARRARKGLFSANFILCRDAGNQPVQFKKLKGKWIGLGYTSLEKGVILANKMDMWKFRYPDMKGIDAYDNLYEGLKKAAKNAIKMLKRKKKDYDYFYIHFKETDAPGHDNKPLEKVKMIELLDKKFFSFLRGFVERNKGRLVVTPGHTTSCKLKRHAENPVPVLFYNPNNLEGREKRFTEEEGLNGKKIIGRRLLEITLFLN
jgi:2,3-bisphosphoglycerate-independent phosphoglycerate mutase